MSEALLHVAKRPCSTCPYARSTPPGIWHPDEYAKLPLYDEDASTPTVSTFHCHQENATGTPTVCRGWLGTHRESVAVRFAQVTGLLRPEDVPTEDDSTLYETGAEAQQAGTLPPWEVSALGRRAQERLVRKGAGRS